MTPQELSQRFDTIGERLFAYQRELTELKALLVDKLDHEIVGDMIAELSIAWEECIGLAWNIRGGCIPTRGTTSEPSADEPAIVCTSENRFDLAQIDWNKFDDELRRAVQRAVWEHKQLGYPIYAMKDGKMQWIPPEEIEVEKPQDD